MNRRVVITGMGVVSPIGIGVPAFFEGLRTARAGVKEIHSFDASAFPTRVAAEVNGFDSCAMNLPETERPALLRDRKSAFGLIAAREAMRSGFSGEPARSYYQPERLGIMVSAGLEIFNLQDLTAHLRKGEIDEANLFADVAAAPAGSHLQIPAHLGARCIARESGAEGLFAVNVSACAAGTQAIGEGFLAIRDGALDAVITGGYDSMINPLGLGGFCLLKAMTTSNELGSRASRPFDMRRDGFVLGEGAGMCILEERGAALARGARIHGEVLGYSSSLDAYRVTDPHPDHVGAITVMRAALQQAGCKPSDIDYINAHGTATRQNDPAETAAIRKVLGDAADKTPASSTKSQIGHLIGAAGAVEFIAALFALNEQILPATINLSTPDPRCDLDYVPLTPRKAKVGVVMSNSFGFGGQNASILVGQPREK